MNELHDAPKCTPWIHDLLDLIEKDMLLVLSSGNTRKDAPYLLAKLREMDSRAQSSASYCVDRKPQNRLSVWTKPPGVLSELSHAAQRHVKEVKPSMDIYNLEGMHLHRSLRPSEWNKLEG